MAKLGQQQNIISKKTSQKFSNVQDQETVRKLQTPRQAFDYAKKAVLPANWHTTQKYQVMLTALRAKFQKSSITTVIVRNGQ